MPHLLDMDVERPNQGHVAHVDPERMSRSGTAGRPLARRPVGLQLFASAQDEPRSRRPTDVVLAITSVVLMVLSGLAFTLLTDSEQAISGVVSSVPGFFDTLWRLLFWMPVAWSFVILVVATVRGRLALVRDLVVATVLSIAGAAAVAAIVTSDRPNFGDTLFDVDGPPVFPPVLV